jgi:hypothetical protein
MCGHLAQYLPSVKLLSRKLSPGWIGIEREQHESLGLVEDFFRPVPPSLLFRRQLAWFALRCLWHSQVHLSEFRFGSGCDNRLGFHVVRFRSSLDAGSRVRGRERIRYLDRGLVRWEPGLSRQEVGSRQSAGQEARDGGRRPRPRATSDRDPGGGWRRQIAEVERVHPGLRVPRARTTDLPSAVARVIHCTGVVTMLCAAAHDPWCWRFRTAYWNSAGTGCQRSGQHFGTIAKQ